MQASSRDNADVTQLPARRKSSTLRETLGVDRRSWPLIFALALLATSLLLRADSFWGFTLDDSFITLRYARHLAQGLGASWNPGAAPAEGYTTVSWMLILSIAELLRIDGLAFAKAIGVVFALGSFLAAALLAQRVAHNSGLSRHAQTIAVATVLALFLSYWPMSLHAVSGMETTLSCFALTAFFLQATTLESLPLSASANVVTRRLALAALACCLTRPEAVLPCAITVLALLITLPERRRAVVRACALWLVLPFVAYYSWRWQHFGLLFPLSFYVKATGQPLFTGLPDVLEFFAPFVVQQPCWGILFVFGAHQTRALRPSLLGALSLVLFFVFPEHIMAFEGRYLLPIFPLLAAASALGMAHATEHVLRRTQARTRRISLATTGLALAVLAALPLPGNREVRAQRWLAYGQKLRSAHVALARDLSSAKSHGGRIALLDVGAIGYYADWYTIDTFGLNDAHVALTRRADIGYVLAQRPDLLVVVSAQRDRFEEVYAWETPLYEAARRHDYQTLCSYEFESDYHLQVLGRGDAQAIRGEICSSASQVSAD